ncbi:MAG: hypothetical protein WBW04_10160, partial [Nitrolancea sp.]
MMKNVNSPDEETVVNKGLGAGMSLRFSRRSFARLSMMGVGASVAGALLSACGGSKSTPTTASASTSAA